jgi:hypothetical protein
MINKYFVFMPFSTFRTFDFEFKYYVHINFRNYAIFFITATLKKHENTGNNDQLVKCKSFNEISIIR